MPRVVRVPRMTQKYLSPTLIATVRDLGSSSLVILRSRALPATSHSSTATAAMTVTDSVSALEFWLSSLDLSLYHSSFLEHGYDDLEICKKIGGGDLSAMGVTTRKHRARIMAAVTQLLGGGATQVYIRAAAAGWRILREEEKREIPRNLLRKMVAMKIINEGVNLSDYPMNSVDNKSDLENLPLLLIQLSHKYSLSLSTHMREVEGVVEELWREELRKQSSIQPMDPHQDCFHKPLNYKTQPRYLPSFQSSTVHPVPVYGQTAYQSSSNPLANKWSSFQSSKTSDSSLVSSPSTSLDCKSPGLNWLNCNRLEDSGISSSSSVDSISCLLSTMRMRSSTSKNKQQQLSSTHLARQYEQVRTQSTLASAGTGRQDRPAYQVL